MVGRRVLLEGMFQDDVVFRENYEKIDSLEFDMDDGLVGFRFNGNLHSPFFHVGTLLGDGSIEKPIYHVPITEKIEGGRICARLEQDFYLPIYRYGGLIGIQSPQTVLWDNGKIFVPGKVEENGADWMYLPPKTPYEFRDTRAGNFLSFVSTSGGFDKVYEEIEKLRGRA